MDPRQVYKHCPKCGNKLRQEKEYLICEKCAFRLYINPVPCNAVIIENGNQEILLVLRRTEPQKGKWDLPGGFINPDEDFEESVKREIREELHVEVEILEYIGIYTDKYLYQEITYPTICTIVSARIISGNLQPDDDIAGLKFIPKEKVLNLELAFSGIRNGLRDYLQGDKINFYGASS